MAEGKTWGSLAHGHVPCFRAPTPARALSIRWPSCITIAAACALLVGCSEPRLVPPEDASGPLHAGTPTVALLPEAEATPVAILGEVVWASSSDPVTNAPQLAVGIFTPQAPRIAAFVLANALPAGSTIAADWEYNDTSLDAFSRQIVVPTATDQIWFSFHIDRGNAEPWPVGTYEVTISLNGHVARQAAVEVAAPA